MAKLLHLAPVFALVAASGCIAPWTQKQDESELDKRTEAVNEVMSSKDRPELVGQAARIQWNDTREYEGYGLVNGLLDTGADVQPSGQRDYILREMRADGVENPNQVLKLKTTALGAVSIIVGPEHTKGDTVDVIVELSEQCPASSLQCGWLMPTQVREMALLGGSVRQSDLKAKAHGPLVMLPKSFTKRESNTKSAVILGGANLLESRILALRIDDSIKHVSTAANISRAINDRYSFYDGSERRGVATAKNDEWIHLDIPKKYRWDVKHFVDSILALGFAEETARRDERVADCRRKLLEPTTARDACLQLESMGESTISILAERLSASDDESRFFAAYSLSYLNHPPAVAVLSELICKDAKFLAAGFVGLQVHEHFSAKEALVQLLQNPDPTIRNGALWALRRRSPTDAIARGQQISNMAHWVMVPSSTPLVAVSLEDRAEIAVFGSNPLIKQGRFAEVNSRLTVRPQPDGRLRIVRFQPAAEDVVALVSPDLFSLVDGFQRVGAGYGDVVKWLDMANEQRWIDAPIAFNPRPGNLHAAASRLAAKQAVIAEVNDDGKLDAKPGSEASSTSGSDKTSNSSKETNPTSPPENQADVSKPNKSWLPWRS